jgi:hypothetical protein
MASNPILNVNGEDLERLKAVFGLARYDTALGYGIQNGRIAFFWTQHDKMIPFPAKLSMDRCAELAFDWLQSGATYPSEPGHDGDNHKGWRCFTEGWGHIEPFGYPAFLAVEPHWIMYGK